MDFNNLLSTPLTFSQLITYRTATNETQVNLCHLLCTNITDTTKLTTDLWLSASINEYEWNLCQFVSIFVNWWMIHTSIKIFQTILSFINHYGLLQTFINCYNLSAWYDINDFSIVLGWSSSGSASLNHDPDWQADWWTDWLTV